LQGIDDRVGAIDGGRMDDLSCRFVDGHKPPVLEKYTNRQRGGSQELVGWFDKSDPDLLAGIDAAVDRNDRSIDLDQAGLYETMNTKAGVVAEIALQDHVDTTAAQVFVHRKAQFQGSGHQRLSVDIVILSGHNDYNDHSPSPSDRLV
jgi:hypothetical protein